MRRNPIDDLLENASLNRFQPPFGRLDQSRAAIAFADPAINIVSQRTLGKCSLLPSAIGEPVQLVGFNTEPLRQLAFRPQWRNLPSFRRPKRRTHRWCFPIRSELRAQTFAPGFLKSRIIENKSFEFDSERSPSITKVPRNSFGERGQPLLIWPQHQFATSDDRFLAQAFTEELFGEAAGDDLLRPHLTELRGGAPTRLVAREQSCAPAQIGSRDDTRD